MALTRKEDTSGDAIQKIVRVLPLWQYLMGLVTTVAMVLLSAGMVYERMASMQTQLIQLTQLARTTEIGAAKQEQVNTEYREWLIRHDKEIDRLRDKRG